MTTQKKTADDIAALFFKPERFQLNEQFKQDDWASAKWSAWITEKQANWLFGVADQERMKANVPPSQYECDGFFTVDGQKYSWTANRFKNRNSKAALMKIRPVPDYAAMGAAKAEEQALRQRNERVMAAMMAGDLEGAKAIAQEQLAA